MYCKFCGSAVAPESSVCSSCGAVINKNDYGQSFFDDKELEMWQSKSEGVPNPNVPRTEIRDAEASDMDPEMMYAPMQDDIPNTRGGRVSVFSRGLSSSNKLIIFCVVSAVIIVLLVVAIINALKPQPVSEDEYPTTDVVTTTQDVAVTITSDDISKGKIIVENIIIQIDGDTVMNDAPIYMYDDRSFVPVDNVLSHINYLFVSRTDSGEIVYKDGVGNQIVIKANSVDFTKTLVGGPSYPYKMDLPCFNDGAVTYVHSKSFFGQLGYNVYIDEENNILNLKSNH